MNNRFLMVASSVMGGAAIGFGFGAYLTQVRLEKNYEESLESHQRALTLAAESFRPKTEAEKVMDVKAVEVAVTEGVPEEVEKTLFNYAGVQPQIEDGDIEVEGVPEAATTRDIHAYHSYIQAEDYYGHEEYTKSKILLEESDEGRFFEIDGVGVDTITDEVGTSFFFDYETNQIMKYPRKDGVTVYVRNMQTLTDYEVNWTTP